jgi:transcription initiation factor IIE alpha subunit
MEIGSEHKIQDIQTEGEIYICPVCSYKDGFHVSFKLDKSGKGEIILICPKCHRRFRLGWEVTLKKG